MQGKKDSDKETHNANTPGTAAFLDDLDLENCFLSWANLSIHRQMMTQEAPLERSMQHVYA